MVDANRMSIPGGGLASFLTSNLDEMDDSRLAFGRQSGINSMRDTAERMAQMGRGGDTFVVHASEREMMVPREVVEKNPELQRQIMQGIAAEGADPNAYIVGSDENSINPMTGQREFFLKKLIRGVKKVFKKIAPIILPIALNFIFPGMGSIAAGALGSGIGTLVQGGSIKDALKSAVIGGVTGGIASGVSGAVGGEGFMAGVKQGFTGTPGAGFFEVNPSIKGFFGGAGADAVASPLATPLAGAEAAASGAPAGAAAPEAPRSFFDRTKDLLIKPDAATGDIAAKAANIKAEFAAKGIQIGNAEAIEAATKALNPGVISKYGNLALAGGALALAGGAFDTPEAPDPFQMGFQPPSQEAIDAQRIFPGGSVPAYQNVSMQDVMVPGGAIPTAQNTGQPTSLAQGPFGLTQPPPFAPINFNQPAPSGFGFDMFGRPLQPVVAAARGGAITEFPRRTGFINGPGTETSDSIPAMLSDGEFVMTARAVRGLGDGSREKGVRKMYDIMRKFEGGAVA